MQVCLHHHMSTGIQTTAEIDKFMSLVDQARLPAVRYRPCGIPEGGEAPMHSDPQSICRASATFT